MNPDDKFWLLFWLIVAVAVLGTAWAIAWGATIEGREAIKAGLVQKEVPSTMTQHWVKP